MPDFRSVTDRRATRRTGDDRVAPRPPFGIVPSWGPLRARAIGQVRKGGDRAGPSHGTGRAHLAAAVRAMARTGADVGNDGIVGAALDMIDGTVAGLTGPAARHHALVLAAAAHALAGRQVHVVCLSERTAGTLAARAAPLLEEIGARWSVVPDVSGIDERMAAHRAHVVFASSARLAQDTLRDHELLGAGARGEVARVRNLAAVAGAGALIRGNPVALVDDADLVMVEAQRAVTFAADPEEAAGQMRAEEAFVILRGLQKGVHYVVDDATRRIRLTDAGEERMELAAALFEGPWSRRAWREQTILAALTVRDFFEPGQDYRVADGVVELARTPAARNVEPGIDALVAAKEGLARQSPARRLWNVRRYLGGYGVLAGIGFAVAEQRDDFTRAYGLEVRDRSRPAAGAPPALLAAEERRPQIAARADGAVIWAPLPDDAKRLDPPRERLVTGDEIFTLDQPPGAIVQIAAAPERWERRLADCHPGAAIAAFADGEDALFRLLPENSPEQALVRNVSDLHSYRAAQAAVARFLAARRAAHLRSDRYFERILAFAGNAP